MSTSSTTPASRFIIMTASAPHAGKGTYKRVAVVEVDAAFEGTPSMISPRAKGVRRIVQTWEHLSVGRTDKCQYRVALADAERVRAHHATA